MWGRDQGRGVATVQRREHTAPLLWDLKPKQLILIQTNSPDSGAVIQRLQRSWPVAASGLGLSPEAAGRSVGGGQGLAQGVVCLALVRTAKVEGSSENSVLL